MHGKSNTEATHAGPNLTVLIVPMTPAHHAEAYALWQQAEGVGVSVSDEYENITRYLERNPGMSQVAVEGERVVGVILAGHDGRRGFIWHLAVDPEHRRRGIGRRLVKSSLEQLRQAGIPKTYIFAFDGNDKGRRFWQALRWEARTELLPMCFETP